MLETVIVIIIGLVGGVAVGIQSPIAGAMGQRIGGTASSVIMHLSGFIFSAILLAFQGGQRIREWHTLPWYMLCAGISGLILYQTINITFPRLGATAMMTLIIVGQLLVGVMCDSFGWLGAPLRTFDITRALGVLVLIIGGYLIVK